MICTSCGANNSPNAQFCAKCGAPLAQQPLQSQPPQQPQQPQPMPQAQPAFGQGQMSPAYNQPASSQVATPSKPESAFARGFRDIAGSPGWFVTYLKLLVESLFPIINFLPAGYAINWGADLVKGKNTPLPKGVFNHRCFGVGVLVGVLNFIALLMNVVLFWLNLIPIIGFLAVLFANTFITGFVYMAAIRGALQKKASAAFDFSEIFKALSKNPWQLFLAVFLPGLITAAIEIVLAVIICCIVFIPAVVAGSFNLGYLFSGGSSSYGGYHSGSSGAMPFAILGNLLGSIVPILGVGFIVALILFVVLTAFLSVFKDLWVIRSVSHWVSDNVPEWATIKPENAAKPNSWL